MTQTLGPQTSPQPIRIAGTSNDDGSVQDMTAGGWFCYQSLHRGYGNEIVAEQEVTETINVVGLPAHFNVEMPLADVALLLPMADGAAEEYYWRIRVGNPADPNQTVKFEKLIVALEYGLIQTNPVTSTPGGATTYTPATAGELSSGVQLSTIEAQEPADGPPDENGYATPTSEAQIFSAAEVNRMLEIANANGQILHDHITNAAIHGGGGGGGGGDVTRAELAAANDTIVINGGIF